MIQVVLDTNIYLSAIIFGGKPRKILLKVAQGKISVFVSKEILAELRGILRKKFSYSLAEIDKAEQLIAEIAQIVEPKQTLKIIPHQPMDNHILACCLETNAAFLVSGDKKHLLPLKKIENTIILSPDKFLKLLSRNRN